MVCNKSQSVCTQAVVSLAYRIAHGGGPRNAVKDAILGCERTGRWRNRCVGRLHAANSDGRAPDKCHNEENRSPPGATPSAGWAPWLGPTGKRRLVESGSHFALDD